MRNDTSSTELKAFNEIAEKPVESLPIVTMGFGSLQSFELTQRAAKLLAASTLVPREYRGNIPNCSVALNMAVRMNADPLMVMQNLYLVHGRPSWSAQFMIATCNQSGRFSTLRYEFDGTDETDGDNWGCKAWAIDKETNERTTGARITIGIAKAEGWYDRRDTKTGKFCSKWRTFPEQMLIYRAAAFFVRAHAPDVSMGLMTTEENTDSYAAPQPNPHGETIDGATGEVEQPTPDKKETVWTDAKETVVKPRKGRRTKLQMAQAREAEAARKAAALDTKDNGTDTGDPFPTPPSMDEPADMEPPETNPTDPEMPPHGLGPDDGLGDFDNVEYD